MELGWRRFQLLVSRLGAAGLERETPAGWTTKEMLGHMAFWEETIEPVIVAMFRGEQLAEGWAFGSGYTHPEGSWPIADVHNAREAAWARPRSMEEVLARLDTAHARAVEIVCSLSDDELQDPRYQQYLGDKVAHYDEHGRELEALLNRGSGP